MSNPYVIAPYAPTPKNWSRPPGSPPLTSLRIAPAVYRAALLLEWPHADVGGGSARFPLTWDLYVPDAAGELRAITGEGMLADDFQTVLVKHPCLEYILWHRAFVPARYRLYLSGSDPGRHVELVRGMTLEQVAAATGLTPSGT